MNISKHTDGMDRGCILIFAEILEEVTVYI